MSQVTWDNKKKYCSKDCYFIAKKGSKPWNTGIKGIHLSPETEFKKGIIPWVKGRKGYLSEKAKQSIREKLVARLAKETKWQKENRIARQIETRKRNNKPRPKMPIGDKAKLWKGDKAGYMAKHKWIQNHWVKTDVCEICNQLCLPRPGTRLKHKTQWSNRTGKYLRERNDWQELCPKCHRQYDIENNLINL
jgi:hypothetical protein